MQTRREALNAGLGCVIGALGLNAAEPATVHALGVDVKLGDMKAEQKSDLDWVVTSQVHIGLPKLFVLECPTKLSQESAAMIRDQWHGTLDGTGMEGVKLVILQDGMKLQVVNDYPEFVNAARP